MIGLREWIKKKGSIDLLMHLGLNKLLIENLGMLLVTRLNYMEIESKKQQQILAVRSYEIQVYVSWLCSNIRMRHRQKQCWRTIIGIRR